MRRFVIELKKDAMPQVVINQLYQDDADLQTTFGVIMLALVPDPGRGSSCRRCST